MHGEAPEDWNWVNWTHKFGEEFKGSWGNWQFFDLEGKITKQFRGKVTFTPSGATLRAQKTSCCWGRNLGPSSMNHHTFTSANVKMGHCKVSHQSQGYALYWFHRVGCVQLLSTATSLTLGGGIYIQVLQESKSLLFSCCQTNPVFRRHSNEHQVGPNPLTAADHSVFTETRAVQSRAHDLDSAQLPRRRDVPGARFQRR